MLTVWTTEQRLPCKISELTRSHISDSDIASEGDVDTYSRSKITHANLIGFLNRHQKLQHQHKRRKLEKNQDFSSPDAVETRWKDDVNFSVQRPGGIRTDIHEVEEVKETTPDRE